VAVAAAIAAVLMVILMFIFVWLLFEMLGKNVCVLVVVVDVDDEEEVDDEVLLEELEDLSCCPFWLLLLLSFVFWLSFELGDEETRNRLWVFKLKLLLRLDALLGTFELGKEDEGGNEPVVDCVSVENVDVREAIDIEFDDEVRLQLIDSVLDLKLLLLLLLPLLDELVVGRVCV